jgi:hypothetical protein
MQTLLQLLPVSLILIILGQDVALYVEREAEA